MATGEMVAVDLSTSPVGRPVGALDRTSSVCERCASEANGRFAVARCRFCSHALCSQHLAAALPPRRERAESGCHHVFVATGWLEQALRR